MKHIKKIERNAYSERQSESDGQKMERKIKFI